MSKPLDPRRRWRTAIPQTAPQDLLRDTLQALLRDFSCGQREASRLLGLDADGRRMRRWCADPGQVAEDSAARVEWRSVELLRRLLLDRARR